VRLATGAWSSERKEREEEGRGEGGRGGEECARPTLFITVTGLSSWSLSLFAELTRPTQSTVCPEDCLRPYDQMLFRWAASTGPLWRPVGQSQSWPFLKLASPKSR